jgi:hypothetical protein
MEAARSSETLANFNQTTRRNNPEDSHLHEASSLLIENFWISEKYQLPTEPVASNITLVYIILHLILPLCNL